MNRIGIQNAKKLRTAPPELFTLSLEEVVDSCDLLIEVMGGTEPAGDLVRKALSSGKSVVTANKELVAKQGADLFASATGDAVLRFEAAVGAAIPIVRACQQSLALGEVTCVQAVLNGTTNFILTKMGEDRLSYEVALTRAQQMGFAEADPTSDVDGFDTTYKISILGSILSGKSVLPGGVTRQGIRQVRADDLEIATEIGCSVKLLAELHVESDSAQVTVQPVFMPISSPLARLRGATNGAVIHGERSGEIVMVGPGAGGAETASAILGDLHELLVTPKPARLDWSKTEAKPGNEEPVSRFAAILPIRKSVPDLQLRGIFDTYASEVESIFVSSVANTKILVISPTTSQRVQRALDTMRLQGWVTDDARAFSIPRG